MSADTKARYSVYRRGHLFVEPEGSVPVEMPLIIYVNGRELVTLMCSPTGLEWLVAGFLFLSNLVVHRDDILLLDVNPDEGLADVELRPSDRVKNAFRRRRRLTSGCGGGLTLEDISPPGQIQDASRITAEEISSAMQRLTGEAKTYNRSGGLHTSALFVDGEMVTLAEDIGRHNTIDKIAGECFMKDLCVKGSSIFTTGRLSSEMALKGLRLGVPIVVSRSSPTSLAINVAERGNMTLVGYARGTGFRIYTHPWRIEYESGVIENGKGIIPNQPTAN